LPHRCKQGGIDQSLYGKNACRSVNDKSDIIVTWANAIRESFSKTDFTVRRVGIAMPGPFDYEKGIGYIKGLHKFEHLYGENVKELLATNLGIQTDNITMLNDASAFLWGEINCGAGAGYQTLQELLWEPASDPPLFLIIKFMKANFIRCPIKTAAQKTIFPQGG
jgi:glucokinase